MTFDEFKRRYRSPGALQKFWGICVLIINDAAATMACFGLGFFLVNSYNLEIINFKSFVTYWPYIPAFIVVFYLLHLYPGYSIAHAEELRRFVIASTLGHAGIILSLMITYKKLQLDAYECAFVLSWLASVFVYSTFRGITRRIFHKAAWWGIPIAVFGAGKTGKLVVDRLLKKPWIGYKPVLMLDDDPSTGEEYRGLPILRGLELGPRVTKDCGITTALVAMPGLPRERLFTIMADYVRSFRYYTLIPDYIGVTSLWMSVRDYDGILGLYTAQSLLVPFNRFVKRFFDIVLCIFGGLVILPFVGLIALCIKLDSPGPIFYGHHRLGKDGAPLRAWKFRSMIQNSKEALERHLAENPQARAEWNASLKLRDDPRITRVGKFLRITSLDELPQIWNVLKGEMSLIGPRPIVEAEVEKYGHNYRLFSSVKPGLSGLWQVSGRSETDYEERVALDILYIQSWSLWLDMYILLKTFGVVIGGKGAY